MFPSCGNSMGLLWCLACGVWGWLISGLFVVIYGGWFIWLYGLGDFVVGLCGLIYCAGLFGGLVGINC